MAEDERSKQTIHHDRWDDAEYASIRKEVKGLQATTNSLLKITDTARPEVADMYNMLYKSKATAMDRKDIRDDHLLNLEVNLEAFELAEYQELRYYTRNDRVGAARAVIEMGPKFEELFDRNKQLQRKADELQKLRDELADKLSELLSNLAQQAIQPPSDEEDEEEDSQASAGGGSGDGEDGEGQQQGEGSGDDEEQQLRDEIEALENAIAKLSEQLDQDLNNASSSIRATLRSAMQDASDEARAEAQAALAWGIEPGQLVKMNAAERINLARKWNTPELRQIAELFGALHNIAFTNRWQRVADIPHEVVGVTLGNDIGRVLPEELVKLRHPLLRRTFYKDFAEGRLRQLKMEGKRKVGKGGIVLLEDGSASMGGRRELYAKAVMLVLANIAKKEGREFHLVHFGSPGEYRTMSFTKPSDFNTDHLIEAAELFFNSGTDFETPLNEGMRILLEESRHSGKVNSDIVFLTDGECRVGREWMENFHADLDRIQGAIWGIDVGYGSSTLAEICRDRVISVADLTPEATNNGRDFKQLFASLQRAA